MEHFTYAQLAARGAEVVGIDASAELIRLARERNTDAVDFRVHDLTEPMTWAADGSFDRIVMALVLHHLENPVATLIELRRVLPDNGDMVVSTVHPM